MMILLGIFYFIFGTLIGSFLNVVALRYNTGQSIKGRSRCFSCGKTLCWYELIPLFSYLMRRGKCRSCGSNISIQYPLVEFFTGVLFLGVFLKYINIIYGSFFYITPLIIYFLIMVSILVVILIYDFKHKIIPNVFVYSFIGLSFAGLFIDIEQLSVKIVPLIDLFAGPILFLPFFLLWLVSRGKWMGLGDGKLSLGIGWMLGLSSGFSAVMLAFWLGAAFSVVLLLPKITELLQQKVFRNSALFESKKRFTMKSEIPFAPFLILGFLLVFFFDINVLEIINLAF